MKDTNKFSSFLKKVRDFDLEDKSTKSTSHTSAAAIRLDQIDPVVQNDAVQNTASK